MEATTPELGPVRFWSPKCSSFSDSYSIVVEDASRNFIFEIRKLHFFC